MTERFEHHARTVTLLTLLSRATGLARDATLSRVFGAGVLMDSFFFAFIIPNLFRRLFGEGALAAAYLPVYSELTHDDPQAAKQLASMVVARLMIVLGAVTIVGEVLLYALSAARGHEAPAVWLMMIMLPYMPLVCLVAMFGAMLQVHGRFGPTAAAPIVLNLLIVGAAVGLNSIAGITDRAHIAIVASAVVLAGVIQIVWSLTALRRNPWWTGQRDKAQQPFRRVLQQAAPMIIGLGVLQLNTFFDGIIASYPATFGDTIAGVAYPLDLGAMSAVSYAQRLYQFPLGVFGIAVATAIFPLLSRQANDADSFSATVQRGLRLVVFIGLPASVGLILVREQLAAVILQGGEFTADDTERVGRVLLGYAPAIWAYSMTHVLTRAFYARGDSRTAMKVAVSVVALNLVLNCTLIWTPLREAGLAWSTAICAIVQVLGLSLLSRRAGVDVVDGSVLRSWAKTFAATVAMGAAVVVVMGMSAGSASWLDQVLLLACAVGVGMIVMFGIATVLHMPERWWAIGRG